VTEHVERDLGPNVPAVVAVHTPDEEVRGLALATFVLFDRVSKLVGTSDPQVRRRYADEVVEQVEYLAGEAWDVRAWAEVALLAASGDGPGTAAGAGGGPVGGGS
jgi:hypothetical protein